MLIPTFQPSMPWHSRKELRRGHQLCVLCPGPAGLVLWISVPDFHPTVVQTTNQYYHTTCTSTQKKCECQVLGFSLAWLSCWVFGSLAFDPLESCQVKWPEHNCWISWGQAIEPSPYHGPSFEGHTKPYKSCMLNYVDHVMRKHPAKTSTTQTGLQ